MGFNRLKPTIGVTTIAFSSNKDLVNLLIERTGLNIKLNPKGSRLQEAELIEFLQDCEFAIVGLDIINREILQHLPRLKVISKYGVGLDNINFKDCEEFGIKVLHTQGVNSRSVAELVLGYMLSLCRNIFVTANKMKNGVWEKNGGMQLTSKTIGIIGVGNIGKELINILKPFNCRILVNDILDIEDFCKQNNCIPVSKDFLFANSDIITIHTPLNNETSNLVNELVFESMKRSAIVINTARGGIVNQYDLKHALMEKKIAGAAIDVFDVEPPCDLNLITIPNLITTPHIGGNAIEAVFSMGEASINNLLVELK
jgi:phosphoglycerate dehydrogenase-like enzyme